MTLADLRQLILAACLCASAACSGPGASNGETTSGASSTTVTDSSPTTTVTGGAGTGTETGTAASGTDGGGETDSPTTRFDVGDGPPGPSGCVGDGPGVAYDFKIIWIANSAEGSVSKIDTTNGMELARYRTGVHLTDPPRSEADPSRTTVNLHGDVAVANRSGSVLKIVARREECVDRNGNGTIETSDGPDDLLDFGDDECVAWVHEIADTSAVAGGPRGIAWNTVTVRDDAGNCSHDPDVWIGWRDFPSDAVKIRRIDGATGSTDKVGDTDQDAEVTIEGWTGVWGWQSVGFDPSEHLGVYGGAANAEGDFWALGTAGTLALIDDEDLSVRRWEDPWINADSPDEASGPDDPPSPYGIALDANGDPWMSSWKGDLVHFDHQNEVFERFGPFEGAAEVFRGMAIDRDGTAWVASHAVWTSAEPPASACGLMRFDTILKEVVTPNIPFMGCETPLGISIDADGFVWIVDASRRSASRWRPTAKLWSARPAAS